MNDPERKAKEEPLTLNMDFSEALERLVRVNPRETPQPSPESLPKQEAPPGTVAAPFVKWVGGKRSIVQELVKRLPKPFNSYWEPFIGGGALFFEVQPRLTNGAHLSDSNLDLVLTYQAVKRDPEKLIALLQDHAKLHGETYYYKVREQFHLQDPIQIAARFIYLNKTCFNGLYRVNKKGEFNVPIGSYVNPAIVDADNIRACHKALQGATIEYKDYLTIEPKAGDFVYCDPPYHPVGVTANFTSYTKLDFGEREQAQLRDFALRLGKQGVKVMVSNSDTPLIRDLYRTGKGFRLRQVQAPRMVNCKGDGRGDVNELIITTYDAEDNRG